MINVGIICIFTDHVHGKNLTVVIVVIAFIIAGAGVMGKSEIGG